MFCAGVLRQVDTQLESRAAVPPEVLFSRIGDDAVLLNLVSETYFGLDEVGTDMWQAMVQSPSLREARQRLMQQYDVEAAQLDEDLRGLVGELIEHGLLRLVPR